MAKQQVSLRAGMTEEDERFIASLIEMLKAERWASSANRLEHIIERLTRDLADAKLADAKKEVTP